MPSNFKKLVRERMAKTGETWQTAERHVRGDTEKTLRVDYFDEAMHTLADALSTSANRRANAAVDAAVEASDTVKQVSICQTLASSIQNCVLGVTYFAVARERQEVWKTELRALSIEDSDVSEDVELRRKALFLDWSIHVALPVCVITLTKTAPPCDVEALHQYARELREFTTPATATTRSQLWKTIRDIITITDRLNIAADSEHRACLVRIDRAACASIIAAGADLNETPANFSVFIDPVARAAACAERDAAKDFAASAHFAWIVHRLTSTIRSILVGESGDHSLWFKLLADATVDAIASVSDSPSHSDPSPVAVLREMLAVTR
jgi:hypothetical protein